MNKLSQGEVFQFVRTRWQSCWGGGIHISQGVCKPEDKELAQDLSYIFDKKFCLKRNWSHTLSPDHMSTSKVTGVLQSMTVLTPFNNSFS